MAGIPACWGGWAVRAYRAKGRKKAFALLHETVPTCNISCSKKHILSHPPILAAARLMLTGHFSPIISSPRFCLY